MKELPQTKLAMIRSEIAGFLVQHVLKKDGEFHHDGKKLWSTLESLFFKLWEKLSFDLSTFVHGEHISVVICDLCGAVSTYSVICDLSCSICDLWPILYFCDNSKSYVQKKIMLILKTNGEPNFSGPSGLSSRWLILAVSDLDILATVENNDRLW